MLDLVRESDCRIVTIGAGGGLSMTLNGVALPSTPERIGLLAEFADGSCTRAEGRLPRDRQRRLRRVSLSPSRVKAAPEALAAIAAADVVVLGPGSLHGCVLPTLLVREIGRAVATSRAPVAMAMNLMTEPGRTDRFAAADFVLALRRHAPQVPLALTVLLNSSPIPASHLAHYATRGAFPVPVDLDALQGLGCRVVREPLLAPGLPIRHDATRLARALRAIALA